MADASSSNPPDPQLDSRPQGVSPKSFAAAARSREPPALFPPVQLAPRQVSLKDGIPMITFSKAELQPGKDRLQHALVAKFTTGRPHIDEVRRAFWAMWSLPNHPTIGALDGRHILIICRSGEDANYVLAHPARKLGQSLFRLFRWSADYSTKSEPTNITTWVRLPALPSEMLDQGYISSVVSTFGRFLAVDDRTKLYSNPSFARACVEVDVERKLPNKVLINLGGERLHTQDIVYENCLHYCSRCNLHGHHVSTCRKVHRDSGRDTSDQPVDPQNPDPQISQTTNQVSKLVQTHKSSEKGDQIQIHKSSEKGEQGWELVQKKKQKRKAIKQLSSVPASQAGNRQKGIMAIDPQQVPKELQSASLFPSSRSEALKKSDKTGISAVAPADDEGTSSPKGLQKMEVHLLSNLQKDNHTTGTVQVINYSPHIIAGNKSDDGEENQEQGGDRRVESSATFVAEAEGSNEEATVHDPESLSNEHSLPSLVGQDFIPKQGVKEEVTVPVAALAWYINSLEKEILSIEGKMTTKSVSKVLEERKNKRKEKNDRLQRLKRSYAEAIKSALSLEIPSV